MAAQPVRVGWLSTASIGRKNSWALRNSGNTPAVVGSRDAAKAQAYAAAWGFERAAASYDEVVADPAVDAVYVPLPTGLRVEWALRAVAAGKHVLIDKPCARSLGELQALCRAARDRGVQLMDGVMFMHNPRLAAMTARLGAGAALGRPLVVQSMFGFAGDAEFAASNIRVDPALEPAGCLGDLAWYDIRLALCVFGGELPTHARCDVHRRSAGGVPTEATTTLYWADGRRLVAFNSFHIAFQQRADVACERGTLRVDDFVLPRTGAGAGGGAGAGAVGAGGSCAFTVVEAPRLEDCDREIVMRDATVAVALAEDQAASMWRAFCGLVRSGARDRSWPEVALKTQACLDAAVASAEAGGERVAVAPIGDDY